MATTFLNIPASAALIYLSELSSLTNNNNNTNNNGKPNPDNVVLYLYTTYDTNSFHPISIRSFNVILVHLREFHDV